MLEEYVEVPRPTSLLNMKYVPTPTRNRSSDSALGEDNDDEEDEEEF